MCGLVGCAGLITSKEESLFRKLLVLDSLRGEHSTGIASVNYSGDVIVSKQVGDPFFLLEQRATEAIFRRANRLLMGHNRFATTGSVTRKNAHPFEFEKLVGAHNGTSHNKHALLDGNKFDVDSEALLHHIQEEGVEDAIGKARGAWAISFYDKEKGTINFLRNKERPLSLIMDEKKEVLFWASEAWMLTSLFHRENYKHEAIFELPVDTLYTFEVPIGKGFKEFGGFSKPRGKKIEGAPAVVSTFCSPSAYGHNKAPAAKDNASEKNPKVAALPVIPQAATGENDGAKFLGEKDLFFYVKGTNRDEHGAQYLVLYHLGSPMTNFRLYIGSRKDLYYYEEDDMITADVSSFTPNEGKPYYKVSPWSVKAYFPEEGFEDGVDITSLEEIHIPKKRNGDVISKKEFEEKYHTCGWCNASVSYGEICEIYDNTGGLLCSSCMVDASINQYIRGAA